MAKKRNPKGLGHYSYNEKDSLYCWRYTIDKQTIYRSSKTEKGLQEKVKEVIGLPVIKDRSTVASWFDRWLDVYVKPLRKPATYQQYYYIYTSHIEPKLGSRKLATIKPFDIQSVIADMHKKDLSAKTMQHAKTIMGVAFKKALSEKLINVTPVVGIEIPSKQAKAKKVLSLQELALLYESMKNSRWLPAIKFGLVTGLRRGELLSLRWSSIEWENSRVQVSESNSNTGLGDTKGSKTHYVPLSAIAIKYLDNQIEILLGENNPLIYKENNTRLKPKDIKNSNFLVFPTQKGTMIKPNTFYHTMVRYAEKVDVEAHPHSLRHTFVYRMRNTLSLKELQNALGHDESTTTLDIYGDMIDDTVDKTAGLIDDVFTNMELVMENKKLEEEENSKVINLFERKRTVK